MTEKYFSIPIFLAPVGRSGVEFFFVLSGFIIMLAHRDDIGNPERLLSYLKKRVVRIYPVYWFVFLLTFVVALNVVKLDATEFIWALLLLPSPIAPVISVAWSLQYEVVFYAIFAAFIKKPILGVLAGVAVWVWLPMEQTYLLMFMMGVAGAIVYQSDWKLPRYVPAMVGVIIFAAAAWNESGMGIAFRLWYAFGAFLIVLGLATDERAGWVFGKQRWLQGLGDASYAIYLVHYPLISGLYKAAKALGLMGIAGAIITYLISLIASLLAGFVLHKFIERPVLNKLRSSRQENKTLLT